VYLSEADKPRIQAAMAMLRAIPGMYSVLNREEACKAFELPPDRTADIVCLVCSQPPSHFIGMNQAGSFQSRGNADADA
jgi:hypothetical protein